MENNRFLDFDKAVSKQLDEIFLNPENHKFYSCFDYFNECPTFGSRGGRVKGQKSICWYCGQRENGHAEETKELFA